MQASVRKPRCLFHLVSKIFSHKCPEYAANSYSSQYGYKQKKSSDNVLSETNPYPPIFIVIRLSYPVADQQRCTLFEFLYSDLPSLRSCIPSPSQGGRCSAVSHTTICQHAFPLRLSSIREVPPRQPCPGRAETPLCASRQGGPGGDEPKQSVCQQ